MDLTDFNTGKTNRRKQSFDLSLYGYSPPQAKDLEKAILGAIMLEGQGHNNGALDRASEILKNEEVFYVDSHRKIYTAIIRLTTRSQPYDCLSVIEQLRSSGDIDLCGGPEYILGLTNYVVSSASVEHHSRIVFQKYVSRKIIEIGGSMAREALEDTVDPFELLDKVEGSVFQLTNGLNRKDSVPIENLLVAAVQDLEARRHNQEALTGISSGFPSIDKITHGWQNTDLIILAARPSVGKTAFALNLARNAAKNQFKPVPVAVFSLEMSAKQLINRMISAESEIALEKILKGRLEDGDMKLLYQKGIQRLADAPIFIDDSPGLNIFEMRAKCRRLKATEDIGLIIIDYLQLMSGVGEAKGNREQEISNISRSLKSLAKELDVPIIALSQLSRKVEDRTNKKPQLSDLRESGAIEQDADAVLFLYRPEYHGIHHGAAGDSNVGETEIRFAKHRNGALETISLRAELWIQKFFEKEEGIKSPIYKGNGLDFKKLQGNDRQGLVPISQITEPNNDEDPF